MDKKIFAFDFDGVIGLRSGGFKGHDHESEPNIQVIETIRALKGAGHIIIIHSTRGEGFLREYCFKHNIPVDYYNENPHFDNRNKRKPVATVYIDDRAVCYKGQGATELIEELMAFKPYKK